MGKYFGTDGVRGVAGADLTCEMAMLIGRGAAAVLTSSTGHKPRILIGKDTRQSGDMLEAALTLPGGVYNFGSENAENMVLTARQFAETLGITVDIQEADWARNLAMDCSKLRAQGIVFDTTQAGLTRCLRDYGLL